MTEDKRWEHIIALDEELLKGGVILSEWCSFIVRDADTAFANGAFLSSILTSVSGIETYLKSEYDENGKKLLFELIETSPIDDKLKTELHNLRKYRNKWVHVHDPWDDTELIEKPGKYEKEIEEMAFYAARLLRKTIYENQWI